MATSTPKFLVTGSTGQLGVQLVSLLRSTFGAASTLATDVRLPTDQNMLNEGPYAFLDVTNGDAVRRLADQHEATHIVHLASLLSAVGEANPELALRIGNEGTKNVLEAARDCEGGSPRTVYAPSSIAVFGPSAGKVAGDKSHLMPSTVYGITKVHLELLGAYYRKKYGVDFRSLRYPGVVSATPGGGGTTDWSMDMLMYARQMLSDKAAGKTTTAIPFECFLKKDTFLPYVSMDDTLNETVKFMSASQPPQCTYSVTGLSFTPEQLHESIRRHIPEFEVTYNPCAVRQKIADSWPDSCEDSAARRDWNWNPAVSTADALVDQILFHEEEEDEEEVVVAVGQRSAVGGGGIRSSGMRHGPSGVRLFSSSAAAMPAAAEKTPLKHLTDAIEEAKGNGTFKRERTITTPQSPHVHVAESNSEVLNFCANNYLGLANHPALKEAAIAAIASHGVGMASVRFICGTTDLHRKLEHKISDFHHADDTILYPSCFDANAGLFETILGPEDAVISDALNHASIIDGIRLCKAKRFRYAHADLADLEEKLVEARDARVRMIATDGVFSMDGDHAPLKEIVRLAKKHDALVMVDECHATGVIGKTGRGTLELEGVLGEVDIVTSTLGKAMGGASGGFTTGRQEIIDVLRQKSRPYLFSNSVPPPLVAAATAAFDVLEKEGEPMLAHLQNNAQTFRKLLTEAGFTLKPGNHPIVPVMLFDAPIAAKFSEELSKRGIYAVAFSYPVVPKGQARIRTQMSAAHTLEDVQYAANAFIEAGKVSGAI